MDLIGKLREQRKAKHDALQALAQKISDENRAEFTENEASEWATLKTDLTAIDERISELAEQQRREAAAADVHARMADAGAPSPTAPSVQVGAEPLTYQRGNGQSFFRDVVFAQTQGDDDARARLRRHAAETAEQARRHRGEDEFVRRHGDREARMLSGEMERRAMSRTDGAGGELVPPLWLVEEFAALARAARPTADLIGSRPLPMGTDSINLPRVTGGTATGVQTADNAPVVSQDMTTDAINAPVRTIAGQVDTSLQLLEQSPASVTDEVLFADLIADYNTRLDVQVLTGSGASGQMLGILQVSGVNGVTYTDTDPTLVELYPKLADAKAQIHNNRKLPPQAFLMTPLRWGWFEAGTDTTNRPLVHGDAESAFNSLARLTSISSENVVGRVQSLPIVVDGSLPETMLGPVLTGGNQDPVIALRFSDLWLWEGALRTRTLPEVLSGTLGVRLQVYAYAAHMPHRYPTAISVITGTGMAAPTF